MVNIFTASGNVTPATLTIVLINRSAVATLPAKELRSGNFAVLKNGSRSTTMLFPISQDSAPAVAGQDVKAFGIGMRHMF